MSWVTLQLLRIHNWKWFTKRLLKRTYLQWCKDQLTDYRKRIIYYLQWETALVSDSDTDQYADDTYGNYLDDSCPAVVSDCAAR